MHLDKWISLASRTFFAGAFILVALAALKGGLQALRLLDLLPGKGFAILGTYTPGRLMEFAGILLIFVIAILLRQIREELASGSRG